MSLRACHGFDSICADLRARRVSQPFRAIALKIWGLARSRIILLTREGVVLTCVISRCRSAQYSAISASRSNVDNHHEFNAERPQKRVEREPSEGLATGWTENGVAVTLGEIGKFVGVLVAQAAQIFG